MWSSGYTWSSRPYWGNTPRNRVGMADDDTPGPWTHDCSGEKPSTTYVCKIDQCDPLGTDGRRDNIVRSTPINRAEMADYGTPEPRTHDCSGGIPLPFAICLHMDLCYTLRPQGNQPFRKSTPRCRADWADYGTLTPCLRHGLWETSRSFKNFDGTDGTWVLVLSLIILIKVMAKELFYGYN